MEVLIRGNRESSEWSRTIKGITISYVNVRQKKEMQIQFHGTILNYKVST